MAEFSTKFKFRALFLSLSLWMSLFAALPVWAAPTYGAEFNFSNNTIRNSKSNGHTVNSDESEAARESMMQEVKRVCGDCKITPRENDYGVLTYHVTYPDGWYFDIATDPAVVEIQTKPSSLKTIQKNRTRIQKHIFATAAKTGLLPASQVMGQSWAGSHIHIGAISALGEGPEAVLLLKNFMVDFSNHSELALGIFSYDTMNAPPLLMLPKNQQNNFRQIVKDVDSGKIRSINTFAKRIRDEVYDVNAGGIELSPTTKYHAFNVNRIGNRHFPKKAQTFELRAMRGQESADDFLILTQLIEARLDFLEARGTAVEIEFNADPLAEEMTPAEKALNFHKYVTETGLDFAPYEKFLNDEQREALITFNVRAADKMCGGIFLH